MFIRFSIVVLQRHILVTLVEQEFLKAQAAVHAGYQQSAAGGGTRVLARAALPKATRPRLEEERAILPVLFGGVVPGRGVALGCGLVAFRSKGIAPGLFARNGRFITGTKGLSKFFLSRHGATSHVIVM